MSGYKRSADVLYKLTAIYYENKRYARYPRFKVRQQTLSYFHSLKDAEKRIIGLVEKDRAEVAAGECSSEYYGFEVSEIPFDWELVGYSQCTRTYLGDGTFFSETKVSSLWHPEMEPFMGRADNECHFKIGDLCEVWRGDEVSLEIVCNLPPTPEQAQARHNYKRDSLLRKGFEIEDNELFSGWDDSDDSYVTLDGDEGYMPCHSHPSVIDLFPVRRKVPAKLREKLERGLEIVKSENEE